MKPIAPFLPMLLFFQFAAGQEVNSNIPVHYIGPVKWKGERFDTPAYLDASLFATYLDWNLQPDSIPTSISPQKGDAIEVWYVVSKEGKISQASVPGIERNELADFILKLFSRCPYVWSPAYQNGRPVQSFHKMKIIF